MKLTQRNLRIFGATLMIVLSCLSFAKFLWGRDDYYAFQALVQAFLAMGFSHAKIKEKTNVQRANGNP